MVTNLVFARMAEIGTGEVLRIHSILPLAVTSLRAVVCGSDTLTAITGPSDDWAKDLLEAWKHDFDWSAAQDMMNGYPHYLVRIENMRMHFLHSRS